MTKQVVVYAFAGLCTTAAVIAGCKSKQPEAPAVAVATPEVAAPVFQVDPATAGSVHGTVTYIGPRPKPQVIDMSSDPQCVKAHVGKQYDESLLVNGKGALRDAFVYVSKGLEGKHFAVPQEPVTIDQKGCWFRPRVLGVQVGQAFDVTNSDPVTHNIHPMPKDNREWNHSQGPGDPPMHRKFTHVEIGIPVKCNIHAWMHADINVVDSPYFAVTKDDGSFDLPNLPPGTYTVTAWHEGLGTQEATITVAASGKVEQNLQFHAK